MQLFGNRRTFRLFPKMYGVMPYVFLIYLTIPLYYLTEEPVVKASLGYGMLLLFVLSYRQLYFSLQNHERYLIGWLAVHILIILIFSCFYDLFYLFLGFFPANFIGWFPKKRQFHIGLAALFILGLVPVVYHSLTASIEDAFFLLPFLIIMLLSPFGIRSMNKQVELEHKLKAANKQIDELVKREERVRIARDLHDTLGHTLSLITLKSQLAHRLIEVQPERAKAETKEIETTSRTALHQVRELVTSMKAVTIMEELQEIQKLLRAAGITFHIKREVSLEDIPLLTQNIISMCLKEITTNVVKHSQAVNCYLTLGGTDKNLFVRVKDDGTGLEQKHGDGNGIRGMKERLALIDASLSVENSQGTLVEMVIPIVKKDKKEEDAL
ncbi:sensor histidine kinase [Salibacterium aidingense]